VERTTIAGETEVLGENLPSATLSHHKSHIKTVLYQSSTTDKSIAELLQITVPVHILFISDATCRRHRVIVLSGRKKMGLHQNNMAMVINILPIL
jgi:hypothetical protein